MTRLDEIRARLAAATPGPWHWYGNTKVHSLYLATVHSGRRFVMQFARWGMSSAQPRFQSSAHVMVDAKDLVTYEVDYRKDVADINHPDAALIANAPTDIAFLLAKVDELTAQHVVRDESFESLAQSIVALTAQREAARAEVERLTGEAAAERARTESEGTAERMGACSLLRTVRDEYTSAAKMWQDHPVEQQRHATVAAVLHNAAMAVEKGAHRRTP